MDEPEQYMARIRRPSRLAIGFDGRTGCCVNIMPRDIRPIRV